MRPLLPALLVLLLACTVEGKRPARRGRTAEPRGTSPTGEARQSPEPDGSLGRVLPDAPLPIEAMLGAPAADVERHLGQPLGKGMMRRSCVRFVPDRTWFACDYAEQRYADPTGRFAAIGVEYTDGVATSLSWEKIPGSGPFDPAKALRIVGLELPGEPRVEHPKPNVTVYDYFNHAARLRIHGKEFRVQVSVVDDEWAHAKVQMWENDRLTPDQARRRIEVEPRSGPADGG